MNWRLSSSAAYDEAIFLDQRWDAVTARVGMSLIVAISQRLVRQVGWEALLSKFLVGELRLVTN